MIDHASIENFLRRNGFAPTEEELTAIVRRIDVSGDACWSYAEFEESLSPVILGWAMKLNFNWKIIFLIYDVLFIIRSQ